MTIAAFVQQMTTEFMGNFQFMNQEKQKEQRLKARMLEKQHAQELKAYERGRINYDQIEAEEKPGLTKK